MPTYEGYSGYIAPELKEYFEEKYFGQGIRVVPGHWPAMHTKQDVEAWLENLKIMDALFDDTEEEE